MQLVEEKENSEFKPAKLRLKKKNYLVSYSARAEGLVKKKGSTRGVMVIVVGIGHEFKSEMRLIAFHIALILLGKVCIQ